MSASRAIVNVAFGSYFPVAQSRLSRSLDTNGNGVGCDQVFWKNSYPPNSATHGSVPYHFKAAAMCEAAERGHRTLLWLDSVMVVVRPVLPIMKMIEDRGYVLWSHPPGQWTVGTWTSNMCLRCYGMSRAEARGVEMLCSAVFGYSLDHPLGKQLHDQFVSAPADAFKGSRWNRRGTVSFDKGVLGHRHDQSILSILAHRLGLKLSPTPDPVAFSGHEDERTVFIHDVDTALMRGRAGDYVI